jgi:hypothetical protein
MKLLFLGYFYYYCPYLALVCACLLGQLLVPVLLVRGTAVSWQGQNFTHDDGRLGRNMP